MALPPAKPRQPRPPVPARPSTATKRKTRTEMCQHRRQADEYCSRCDS